MMITLKHAMINKLNSRVIRNLSKRAGVGRMILREMECNEVSASSFKVKKNSIIESCTRDRSNNAL